MLIQLRPATLSDAAAICEVYLTSRKVTQSYTRLAHSDAEHLQWISEELIPQGEVSVAEVDGVIVGMMALTRDAQGGWIDQLYLHPDWTGRGIGSQFVELAKARLVNEQNKAAESSIRLYTFQENSGGRRFYERHGFKAIALGDGSANEEGTPDVLYEWRPEDQVAGY